MRTLNPENQHNISLATGMAEGDQGHDKNTCSKAQQGKPETLGGTAKRNCLIETRPDY